MASTFIITSPSVQFTEMVRSVSRELNIRCIIIEAVLKHALEETLSCCRENDVAAIISRGGTADMIRQATDIPVLEAEANDFDILISLMDAKTISKKIAYVQYAGEVIEELPRVTELLQLDVQQYYFRTDAEMLLAITKAQQDGYEVIVSWSDSARKKCDAMGLWCVLVTSSRRTVVELFRRAKLIRDIHDKERDYRKQLVTAFDLVPEGILYLDAQNRVSLINHAGLELLDLQHENQIAGQPITDHIAHDVFFRVLNDRRRHSGKVIDVLGKNVVLRSAPVLLDNRFLGTVLSLQRASEVEKLEHEVRRQAVSSGMTADARFIDLEKTCCSRAMQKCLSRALGYAKTNSTILIMGESGTGKDLLAQSIHNASPRSRHAFVALNCAALPQPLLESELFGYDEGAFSGAKRGGKPGYFELAHEGTLFLNEVGLMPLNMQLQLLRVLQEKQILRVGGRKMIPADVRVIAATNANLEEKVKEGRFRQDLFYRISVLHIAIPPLRRRIQDIPPLAEQYLQMFCKEYGRSISGCSETLVKAFQGHTWPGNVRELVNYMMRLAVCSPGPLLSLEDLEHADIRLENCQVQSSERDMMPEAASAKDKMHTKKLRGDSSIQLRPDTLVRMEEEIIRWHMRRYNGNRVKICEELQISRTTLWKKLKSMQNGSPEA